MRDPALYLGAAAISAGLAAWVVILLTPWIRGLAFRYGAAHAPRARDVHQEPIARWGGLAIFAGFLVSLVVAALVVHFVFHRPIAERSLRVGVGLVLAGTILSIVGAIDDKYELSAGKQIVFQLLCALLLLPFGVNIQVV